MNEWMALGLIETRGLGAAISGADAAVTAAGVRLHGWEVATGGRVTVVVTGQVADVSAAVEAGRAAVGTTGAVLNTRVVAQLGDGVQQILECSGRAAVSPPGGEDPDGPHRREGVQQGRSPADERGGGSGVLARRRDEARELPTRAALSAMRVSELRRLARLEGTLTNAEIIRSSKARLIDSLLGVIPQKDAGEA